MNKIKQIWEDIIWEIDWQYNKWVRSPVRNFKRILSNFWVLRKIIFTYRWWDYEGLIVANEVMLKDMAKNTRKYGITVSNGGIADKMDKIAMIFAHEPKTDYIDFGEREFVKDSVHTEYGQLYRWESKTPDIKKAHIPFSKEYLLKHMDTPEQYRIKLAYQQLARSIMTFWD